MMILYSRLDCCVKSGYLKVKMEEDEEYADVFEGLGVRPGYMSFNM